MRGGGRPRPFAHRPLLLLPLLVAAAALQLAAASALSYSGDGVYHLLAGHQALRYGTNTVNLEHPPLVKLLIAAPAALWPEPLAEPLEVDGALAAIGEAHGRPELFFTLAGAARAVILTVIVAPLLLACYALGRMLYDPATGIALVLLVALSFSVAPLLVLLQTDAAVALGFVLVHLLGLRLLRRPTLALHMALALAVFVALATKHSGLLVLPGAVACVVLAWRGSPRGLVKGIACASLVVVGGFVLLLGSYRVANWDYSSDSGRRAISLYTQGQGTLVVDDRLQPHQELLLAIEELSPGLAQWLTGVLGIWAQNRIGIYPVYAFGEVSSKGRWWFFPALMLTRLPLLVLLAALAAMVMAVRKQSGGPRMVSREQIPIVLTVGLYLGTAVTSNYNLGFRHLLPVLPFLLLPVAGFVARLALARWAIPALLLVESLLLAPLWMSSTNTWWLGRHNPTRLAFSAGELEYMQNFRSLARAARGLGAEGLTVFYPLLDQRVLHAYLPGARLLEPGDEIEPGWYAVSVLIEQYVPAMERATPERLHGYHHLRSLSEQWRSMLEVLVQGEDHGLIAGTFRLYYLDPAAGTNPEAARPAEAGSSPAGWQGTRLEAPPRGRYTG